MDIPVLNIWNESTQRYEGIPAIRGDKGDPGAPGPAGVDGKPAYEYARDGGYTGTEEEFAEKLADDTVDPEQVNKLIDTKLLSVITYGAKGDGATDDTKAFQDALAANRVVTVPGGTYKLSGELVIRDNCQMEFAQDAVLNFTNTSGNCITLNRSAFLKGNHATVTVPYAFAGKVINVDTSVHTDTNDVPPFTHWCPQWKTARYLTDLNICKANSYGLHESLSGDSNGTAVYIAADGSATSTFIWGLNFSGLRIAGSFEYGVRAVNINGAYNHEMRIEAFMDACKVGVSLEDCNNAYISAIVQPRKAYDGTTYATHGIQLIRCENTDLSGSRVWDWNDKNSLWSYDKTNVNQHIAMYGNCIGTILNDYNYHYLPTGFDDLRELIYCEEAYRGVNLDSLIILQEPFTRWFKPVDGEPYFFNGNENKRLVLKSEFDSAFQTDQVPQFTDVLATATDETGAVFNEIGYKTGAGWETDGKTLNSSQWHFCTGFIPCKMGDTLYLQGMSFAEGSDDCRVILYDSNFNKLNHINRGVLIGNGSYFVGYEETEDGCKLTIKNPDTVAYITVSAYTSTLSSNPVISVNEEISYTQEGFLADGIKVKAENVVGNVSGGGGATSWEDLGSKYEEGTVLAEMSPPFVGAEVAGMDMFVFPEAFPLAEGKEYTINWNGTPFTCICAHMEMSGATGLGLGNIGMLTGGTNTGEPFCLGVFDQADAPFPGAAMPLDGTTSLTISITANLEKITPVPEKYLPAYDWNADDGEPGHILNRTHYKENKRVILDYPEFTVESAQIPLYKPFQLVDGDDYELMLGNDEDSIILKATARPYKENGVQLGIACNFNGIIFLVAALPENVTDGIYGMFSSSLESGITIPLTVYKSEKIKQLDPEFIPKNNIPHYDLAELGMNPIEVGNFQNLQYDDFPDGKFNEFRNAFAIGPVSITVPVVGSTRVCKYRLFCLGSYMVRDDGTPDNRIYAIVHDPDHNFSISVWDNYISVQCG